jgi:hypothetical protein
LANHSKLRAWGIILLSITLLVGILSGNYWLPPLIEIFKGHLPYSFIVTVVIIIAVFLFLVWQERTKKGDLDLLQKRCPVCGAKWSGGLLHKKCEKCGYEEKSRAFSPKGKKMTPRQILKRILMKVVLIAYVLLIMFLSLMLLAIIAEPMDILTKIGAAVIILIILMILLSIGASYLGMGT